MTERAPDSPLVVVVGGGIAGLTTALGLRDLAEAEGVPLRLLVLEAEDRAGGKIRTLHDEGFTCEWGVNGFLDKEPRTLELCRRLELEDQLLPAAAAFNRRYIFTRGKLRPVHMHPLKFLLSGLLPFGAVLRLLREPWVKEPPPTDRDESVAAFARRRIGPVGFQVLVDPMQTGIYAGDPEQMSVGSCFPRVVEVEREYGSLIRGLRRIARERRGSGGPAPGAGPSGRLTSFRGGMEVLVERLSRTLGEAVRCGCTARALRLEDAALRLETMGQDSPLRPDAVVLATPARATAGLVSTLDQDLARLVAEIPYPPLAVACLGYPADRLGHPLDGFGFLVPRAEGLRLLGALWASATFPDHAPPGHGLVRAMIGGARDPGVLDLTDGELLDLVEMELARAQGVRGPATFRQVFRHPLAIPQYTLGHGERLTRIDARLAALPGVFLAGNAYRGIGVNDCARNAWPVAAAVLEWLRGREDSRSLTSRNRKD